MINELIEYGIGEESPKVGKIIVEYCQIGDCCESEDDIQTIKLETESNGVAPFIRISIPDNGHWSINDENDLVYIVKDFKLRINEREGN